MALSIDKKIEQRKQELDAEADALAKKAGAISKDLIAALQSFGDKELIERVAKAMGPVGILDLAGGKSVVDVLKQILAGTPLANSLPELPASNGNGKSLQAGSNQ